MILGRDIGHVLHDLRSEARTKTGIMDQGAPRTGAAISFSLRPDDRMATSTLWILRPAVGKRQQRVTGHQVRIPFHPAIGLVDPGAVFVLQRGQLLS